MNKSLKQVKEFMLAFKQPVMPVTHQIEQDRARLRLALLLEELEELSIAYGQHSFFKDSCYHTSTKVTRTDSPNRVEELDALADLQYVLNGAVLEGGFGELFDEAFNTVHENNMTKLATTVEEAIETVAVYKAQGRNVIYEQHGSMYIIYDADTKKALKAAKYTPVNLRGILERFIEKANGQVSMEI